MTEHGTNVKSKTNWLDPINRILFQAAFRKKEESVTLRDGRKFSITYDGDVVFVQSVDMLVPRGYFSHKKVTNDLWVEDTTPNG